MIVSIIIVALFLACIYKLGMERRQPPLASGAWPIVGHTVKFITSPEETYKLLLSYSMESIRCDEALTIRILGTKDVYGLTNPEDSFTVLNSCLQKDVIYDYFKPWVGEGLFAATESVWRKHHKMLRPTFNQEVMDTYLPELNQQAKSLVFKLDAKAGKGKFDHIPYLEDTALRAICSTAMGVIADDKDVELREQYVEAKTKFYNGLLLRAQKFWLHSEFMYNISGLKSTQNNLGNTLRELTNTVVKKRKAELILYEVSDGKRVKPFIEHLLDMQRNGIFTDTEIQEEVDTFTVTGSDTVALTVAVTLLTIGTYPKVQRKIANELREVFQGSLRDVEKQDLVQLKYLEAVIKETWRLYPTVPIVGRLLDKDVKIRNYTLPAGSRCFVSLYGVNRHSSWGADAEQFRPERWLDTSSLPTYHFATFGFGKRRCIGVSYAMLSTKTMLAHLLRHYAVSGDATELVFEWSVVARPKPNDYISIKRNIK